MSCPDLAALERGDATDHIADCASCRIVVDLIAERRRAVESQDRHTECARFEMLLAARDEGTLGPTAADLLAAHLRECRDCIALAATGAPLDDGRPASLPSVPSSAYALGPEVGRGGMGRIFEAQDLRIGRRVAVKELLGRSPALAARFEREARVTARLQHPGIVPIYEIGAWPDGTPFYAMRMVEGRTLRETIESRRTLDERLSLVPPLIAAAEAVAFAHGKKIIHRDLTPNNVLVGEYGDTVVIDWGLAKDLSAKDDDLAAGPYRDAPTSGELTNAGAVIGTAAYMPPEQASGKSVDERADVYALGAILYHVLAGEPPYRTSKSDDVIRQVRASAPPRIREVVAGVPLDLASIVDKAMARDAHHRYRTAAELVEELRRFQTGRLVEAHHYSRGERAVRWVRAHRGPTIGAIAAVVAMTVAGSVGLVGILRERDRANHEREAAEVNRMHSEQERQRADDLTIGLLEDRGRRELLDGNRERAAVFLSAAYSRGADSPALRFMLADAMTALDGKVATLRFAGASEARFDHRGRRIVVTSSGRRAAIFDVATGTVVSELEGLPLDENRLEFSPDDETLFSRHDDTLLRWDVRTGKLTGSVVAHHGSFTFTPPYAGGRFLATLGDKDGVLAIWDTRTLTRVAEHHGLHEGDAELLLSPDERHLVSAPFEGSATVLDASTGRILHELRGNAGRLVAFSGQNAFTPDGKRVVLGDAGGAVTIWDVESGKTVLSLQGHGVAANAKFDPSGQRIVVFDFRRDAYVADASTGKTLARFHGGGLAFIGRFSPDGARVIAARIATPTTGSIDILDAATGTLLQRFEGQVLKGAQASDRLAISDGAFVRVVKLDSGRLVRERVGHDRPKSGGFVPDGRHVFIQDLDRQSIWDPETDVQVPLAREPHLVDTTGDGGRQVVRTTTGIELRGNDGAVLAKVDDADTGHTQVTPDDRRVVVTDAQGTVSLIDASTGARITKIDRRGGAIVALRCSPGGRCATLDAAGWLQVWTFDGAVVASCRPGDGKAGAIALARDGTHVVTLVASATTPPTWQPVLLDVDGCRQVAVLGTPAKERDVTIEFAGSRVLVGHTVWDVTQGARVADIPASEDEIKLMFAADGAHVARISWFDTRLWTLTEGSAPREVKVDNAISDGRFSRDGALFFAGAVDGGVDVVDMATGRVIARNLMPAPVLEINGRNLNTSNYLVDVSEHKDALVTVGPDAAVRIWSISRETRTKEEVARLVEANDPWKLDGATLVRR